MFVSVFRISDLCVSNIPNWRSQVSKVWFYKFRRSKLRSSIVRTYWRTPFARLNVDGRLYFLPNTFVLMPVFSKACNSDFHFLASLPSSDSPDLDGTDQGLHIYGNTGSRHDITTGIWNLIRLGILASRLGLNGVSGKFLVKYSSKWHRPCAATCILNLNIRLKLAAQRRNV